MNDRTRKDNNEMKHVFSIIWKIIAAASIFVGIYLIVQVKGDAEGVIEAYKQLTGNSVGATSSIKIVFLRDYIRHTGNTDILITMGVTPDEAELILNDNLEPKEIAEPEDDTQTPSQPDASGNGSGSGGQGQGGANNPNLPGPAQGANGSINYAQPYDSAGHLLQNNPAFAKLRSPDGDTLKSSGCPIFAIYNAYVSNCGGSPKRLEDIIMEYSKAELGGSVSINSNGWLQGNIGKVGQGGGLWNYIARNYYSPGSMIYNNGSNNGGVSVNSKVTQDGKYLIYYSHLNGRINGDHSKAHWVYAEKVGNSYTVYNEGGEGTNIGNQPIIRCYKVG